MRIAIGGIGHETNTFSALETGLDLFTIRRGEEIIQEDFWDAYRDQSVEWAPTLTASSVPHGVVRREAYEALKGELLARLEAALPVDGVYLSLHGAMEVAEIGDGESDLVGALRACVGPNVPIVASLDLHGNIAPAVVETVNLLTALRTAPHRDGRETRRRALDHLVRCVRDGIRPVGAIVPIPLLLPGEYAITEVEPARSLYAMIETIEAVDGILDASLMIGCAWTDSPFTSAAALVMAASDRALASREATRFAEAVWARRHDFGPDVEVASPEESVARALAAPERPVYLSDSGDNITAGGAGDIPRFVELLRDAGARDAVVAGIADAAAVARCVEAGAGATVTLAIGGKLDAVNARPLPVTGTVARLDSAASPGWAVLQVEGVAVVLTRDRWAFTSRDDFRRVGIDPTTQKAIVLKLGYLFPDLRDYAPRAIMALSAGFTDLRLERLPYARVRRPIYPLDPAMTWRPPPYPPSARSRS